MTERFMIKDSILNDGYVIIDNEKEYSFPVLDSTLNHMFCKALNELHEENNKLRLQLNLCSDQRNEFHRGARENANRVGKLKKENEQLNQQNKGIQDKVWKLLELLEKEKGIDKRKIIDWWNGDVE